MDTKQEMIHIIKEKMKSEGLQFQNISEQSTASTCFVLRWINDIRIEVRLESTDDREINYNLKRVDIERDPKTRDLYEIETNTLTKSEITHMIRHIKKLFIRFYASENKLKSKEEEKKLERKRSSFCEMLFELVNRNRALSELQRQRTASYNDIRFELTVNREQISVKIDLQNLCFYVGKTGEELTFEIYFYDDMSSQSVRDIILCIKHKALDLLDTAFQVNTENFTWNRILVLALDCEFAVTDQQYSVFEDVQHHSCKIINKTNNFLLETTSTDRTKTLRLRDKYGTEIKSKELTGGWRDDDIIQVLKSAKTTQQKTLRPYPPNQEKKELQPMQRVTPEQFLRATYWALNDDMQKKGLQIDHSELDPGDLKMKFNISWIDAIKVEVNAFLDQHKIIYNLKRTDIYTPKEKNGDFTLDSKAILIWEIKSYFSEFHVEIINAKTVAGYQPWQIIQNDCKTLLLAEIKADDSLVFSESDGIRNTGNTIFFELIVDSIKVFVMFCFDKLYFQIGFRKDNINTKIYLNEDISNRSIRQILLQIKFFAFSLLNNDGEPITKNPWKNLLVLILSSNLNIQNPREIRIFIGENSTRNSEYTCEIIDQSKNEFILTSTIYNDTKTTTIELKKKADNSTLKSATFAHNEANEVFKKILDELKEPHTNSRLPPKLLKPLEPNPQDTGSIPASSVPVFPSNSIKRLIIKLEKIVTNPPDPISKEDIDLMKTLYRILRKLTPK